MSCCYEVGKEFKEHFNNPEAFTNKQNKLYFNMARQLQTQLENDFHQCTIDEAKICTHCHSQFHSYRRDATQKRNWNILYY
jgi:copper oxidase (laccase) domain-containing protein